MADVITITPEMFALAKGEGNKLDEKGKENALRQMCQSLGLNPAGVPIQFINLNGKLVPYLTRGGTDQIRTRAGISLEIVEKVAQGGIYLVRVRVTLPDGRTDESTGAVSIEGLRGEALANAYMKAETKAKRRATLSAVGLGMMDESELPTDLPRAQPVVAAAPARKIVLGPAQIEAPKVEAPKPEPKPEPKPVAPKVEASEENDSFPWDAAPVEEKPVAPKVAPKPMVRKAPAEPKPENPDDPKATMAQLECLMRLVKSLDLHGPSLLKPYGVAKSSDLTNSQIQAILLDLQEKAGE